VQWLGHLLPPVFDWLQGFMCVCTQVSCSVLSNWSLCDLFVDMCIVVLLSIIFNFLNFVCSWDTRWWIKSKNTICLILIYHRQNPTEITLESLSACYNLAIFVYSVEFHIQVWHTAEGWNVYKNVFVTFISYGEGLGRFLQIYPSFTVFSKWFISLWIHLN
jgi:hypothetical protein